MTALVSQLFIAMIPIEQNFPSTRNYYVCNTEF